MLEYMYGCVCFCVRGGCLCVCVCVLFLEIYSVDGFKGKRCVFRGLWVFLKF